MPSCPYCKAEVRVGPVSHSCPESRAATEPIESGLDQRLVRHCEAEALAKAAWDAAKSAGLYQDDLVSCCAILLVNVANKTGEPMDYLLSEVTRRSRKLMPNTHPNNAQRSV